MVVLEAMLRPGSHERLEDDDGNEGELRSHRVDKRRRLRKERKGH